MIRLRDYQERFVSGVQASFLEYTKVLGVMPTGAGKTIAFASLLQNYNRTLVLAHIEELIDQAVDKIKTVTGLNVSVEMGERTSLDTDVVVASIQSMFRRKEQFDRNQFDLIICDEAHYSLSPTWQSVLRYFNALVLGVTATPTRGDNRNLGEYYEACPVEISLVDLIEQGYLSRILCHQFPVKIDLSQVRTSDGDFNAEDCDTALTPYLHEIARAMLRYKNRKILVFLPLIKTSQIFTEILRSEGMDATHIDGISPNRKQILEEYSSKTGGCVLCNSSLLSHGVDIPSIDTVMVLRPTKSQPWYSQAIGRGTRIYPGKEYLLVLDPMWLSNKHSLVRPANLICSDLIDASMVVDRLAEIDDPEDLIDLAIDVRKEREEKIAEELRKKEQQRARTVDPLRYFSAIGKAIDISSYTPIFPWERDRITMKQAILIEKFGVSPASIKSKGEASKIIGMIMERKKLGLATPKQVVYLRQFGHPKPMECTFDQAQAFLAHHLGDRH